MTYPCTSWSWILDVACGRLKCVCNDDPWRIEKTARTLPTSLALTLMQKKIHQLQLQDGLPSIAHGCLLCFWLNQLTYSLRYLLRATRIYPTTTSGANIGYHALRQRMTFDQQNSQPSR